MNDQDEEFASAVMRGNELAIQEFYRLYWPLCVRRGYMLGIPQCDLEDFASRVLESLWCGRLAKYRTIEGGSLNAWMHRVITNAAISHCRTRRDQPLEDWLKSPDGKAWEKGNTLLSRTEDSNPTVGEDLGNAVEEALAKLNPRYRTVIQLVYLEQVSREEVADRLGLDDNALRVLLLRARNAIRKLLVSDPRAPKQFAKE